MPPKPEITVLNSMLGSDFATSLSLHLQHGLRWLDLKDNIFNKSITELSLEEASEAVQMIEKQGLNTYALSTNIGHYLIEEGEDAFRKKSFEQLNRLTLVAPLFKPKLVRLLSCPISRRNEFERSDIYLRQNHPWVFEIYRELVDVIEKLGCRCTIENEAYQDIWSTPEEVNGFYEALDRQGQVGFTWDVQNMWQMGCIPTLEIYEQLKPHICYVHFKGGIGKEQAKLTWASSLEDASWPVAPIISAIVRDGISPVVCLNPPHGERKPGYNYENMVERDLSYLRELIESL